MASTRYTKRTDLDELGRYINRPALSPPTMAALAFNTLVARWASTDFTNPVPLVDRRDLEEGDIVYSSFGRHGRIVRIHKSDSPVSQDLYGTPHLNKTVQIWFENGQTERSEGSMPLLYNAATGDTYGHVAGMAAKPGLLPHRRPA